MSIAIFPKALLHSRVCEHTDSLFKNNRVKRALQNDNYD